MTRREFMAGAASAAALPLLPLRQQPAAADFLSFQAALLRKIAAGLGIPYDLLSEDWEAVMRQVRVERAEMQRLGIAA